MQHAGVAGAVRRSTFFTSASRRSAWTTKSGWSSLVAIQALAVVFQSARRNNGNVGVRFIEHKIDEWSEETVAGQTGAHFVPVGDRCCWLSNKGHLQACVRLMLKTAYGTDPALAAGSHVSSQDKFSGRSELTATAPVADVFTYTLA